MDWGVADGIMAASWLADDAGFHRQRKDPFAEVL